MEKKWNLQDIRPAGERRRKPIAKPKEDDEAPAPTAAPARTRRAPRQKRPYLVAVIVALLIIVPGFVIGYLLNGAEVTVHPRTETPTVNGTFEAHREAGPDELSYEIMTLEAEGERQVHATGQKQVSEQATGEIEIQNTRSTSERLIKNTRFESPDGLIYRVTESVVVPAAKDGTPGTVRANVFADQPGETYNIQPTTFTVPGYKEGGYTDLYTAITGKSTTPMQGGFEGTTYIIGDEELAAAKDSLHKELEEALRARVPGERPAGFVLFDSGITFSYESLPSVEAGNDLVTIKEKVSLHAPLFAEDRFASFLASATVSGYHDEPVRVVDPSALTFAYANASSTEATDLRSLDTFSFTLTGTPKIAWTFDHAQLQHDLAGAAKNTLPAVLGNYPAIERAEAVIRPFWKRSFPGNPDDITITETLD